MLSFEKGKRRMKFIWKISSGWKSNIHTSNLFSADPNPSLPLNPRLHTRRWGWWACVTEKVTEGLACRVWWCMPVIPALTGGWARRIVVSSGPAWATRRDPVSEKNQKLKKEVLSYHFCIILRNTTCELILPEIWERNLKSKEVTVSRENLH